MKRVKKNGYNNKGRVAVILAGGQSKRFGSDKVYAKLGPRRFIDISIETLTESGFEVVISVSHPKLLPGLTNPILEDPLPREGPLQALYGALLRLDCSRLLLVACDMPLLETKVLEKLWQESAQADIVVLESQGKPFPLPGIYSENVISYARALLNEGKRDLKSLLKTDLVIRSLPESHWRLLDPMGQSIMNINAIENLKEVKQICFP